ncbi:heparinase II/III domain-containing protein [Microlunatus sp. Y2014]|uniref:heparinase II/III domain-containing protein n=1 Tax=Microlunatus sp. Y2014 TaxID=3418488 RepID=UPI003DA6FC04
MRRRSFLIAGSTVMAAGVAPWTGWSRAAAEESPSPSAGQPSRVAVRTDLEQIAETVDGLSVDGTLGDPRWGEPHWGRFTTLYELDPVLDVAVHAVHDQTNLYVGVRIPGARAQTAGHASILVRPGLTGNFHWATVKLREGGPRPSFVWGGTVAWIAGHGVSTAVADDLVTVEWRIPLTRLGLTGSPIGQQVGVNVVIDHLDGTDGVMTSSPTRTSVNTHNGAAVAGQFTDVVDEDRVAVLHLGAVAPTDEARPAPELVHPTVDMDYLSFRRKTVLVDLPQVHDERTGRERRARRMLSLSWRGPRGEWVPIDAVGTAGNPLTFTHPDPVRPGQYALGIDIDSSDGRQYRTVVTFDRDDLIAAGDRLPGNRRRPASRTETVAAVPASPEVTKLIGLVPDRVGFTFCGVPENPLLRPYQAFSWSPDRPDVVTAISTGTSYPNESYPEDRELTAVNRLGETLTYPYHEGEDGKRYFFSAHLWYQQRTHVYTNLVPLAERDPLGAARVLHRFAQVYPGWVATQDYTWFNRPISSAATPRNFYWGGMWYRWSIADLGQLQSFATAIDLVTRTDAFDVLSAETGDDVEAQVVHGMIEPSIEWFRSCTRRYTNNDYPSYLGLAKLGRSLGDSSHVHETVEWAREYLYRGFLFDGFWRETTLSYHLQSVGGLLQLAQALEGWSDQQQYESPRTGESFTDMDLLDDMAVLGASTRILDVLSYPDGKLFPLSDTWANATAENPDHTAGSVLFGAAGVARLSGGSSDAAETASRSQVYLAFTPKYGHVHFDPLTLALFAEGQELLPDLGYTHTIYRRWSSSTLGHNTVTVDGADMEMPASTDGGSVDTFDTLDPGVQCIRASFTEAYAATDTYQRETWSIQHPGAERTSGYVLDLFRVDGGSRHEYSLNGDANRDAEMVSNTEMSDYGPYLLPDGVTVTEPTGETDTGSAEGHYYGYIYVRDVQQAVLPDGQFDVTLSTRDAGAGGARARILGVAGSDAELFLGRSPSLRATRLNGTAGDTNDEVVKWTMPKLVLRRSGHDLRSDFVTVIDPYAASSGPRVTAVQKLSHDGEEGDLAVKVTFVDGTVDIVISLTSDDRTVTAGAVTLTGKLGWARIRDGATTALHLVGGTRVATDHQELTGPGCVTGTVTRTLRKLAGDPADGLVVSETVPTWAAGQTVIVTHPDGKTHGYPIRAAVPGTGETVIELEAADPGFSIAPDGSSELAFTPFTRWDGPTTFRVDNSETWST